VRPLCLPPRSAARAVSRCLCRAIAVRRLAKQVPGTRPRSTTWRSSSLWGLSRTGFISTDQGASQALLSRWSPPRCGAALRLIAFVIATKRVQRILTHPGEPAELPRSAPVREPPALDIPVEPLPKRDSEAQPGIARVPGGTGRTRWVSRGLMRHGPVANVRLPPDCCHRALRNGCRLCVGERPPEDCDPATGPLRGAVRPKAAADLEAHSHPNAHTSTHRRPE
jgi:hypothetical protein